MTLGGMLRVGGIWRDVPAAGARRVMEQVVARLPDVGGPVRERLLQRLHAADGISWAPVGDGLALPHFRAPAELDRSAGAFALIFLREAIPSIGPGPDGVPVTRLLFLIAPSPRAHLEVLGQLSTALVRGDLRRLVLEGGTDEEIYAALGEAEVDR